MPSILETSPFPVPISRPLRVTTNPHGLAITDDALTALLRTIDALAWQLTSTTGMFEEYRDTGRDALLSAWGSWKGDVPFPAFAGLCIRRRMRGAIREYRRWAFPCAPSALPDADTLHHLIARTMDDTRGASTRELACDPPEPTGWLVRDLARHWPCMSPMLQQALEDLWTERSQAAITARDGVTGQTITSRNHALLAFLRRHLMERETPCFEEVQRWQRAAGDALLPPGVRAGHKRAYDRVYQARRKQARTGGAV